MLFENHPGMRLMAECRRKWLSEEKFGETKVARDLAGLRAFCCLGPLDFVKKCFPHPHPLALISFDI